VNKWKNIEVTAIRIRVLHTKHIGLQTVNLTNFHGPNSLLRSYLALSWINNFVPFLELDGLLMNAQDSPTGPYLEPLKSF
jgi:hypothetical protein